MLLSVVLAASVEGKEGENGMSWYVVYSGEEPVGVFGSLAEAAEFMGVTMKSATWYCSPTAKSRERKSHGNARGKVSWLIEKVEGEDEDAC